MRLSPKTARWTRRTHLFRQDEFICSGCGASCGKPEQTCPKCGAKMKDTKYDPSWVDEIELFNILTGISKGKKA